MEKKSLPTQNVLENELNNLRAFLGRKRSRSVEFLQLFNRLQKGRIPSKKQKTQEALDETKRQIDLLTRAKNDIQQNMYAHDADVMDIAREAEQEEKNSEIKQTYDHVIGEFQRLLNNERKNMNEIRILLNKEETKATRLREEIRKWKNIFEVPALPKWVYNIFAEDLRENPDALEKIVLDLFVYQDFLILWEHRGEDLKTLQTQFKQNPYNVDIKYFDSVAKEKAEVLVDFLNIKEVQDILKSTAKADENIQNAIVDMYNTLLMEITAYKIVLDALIEHQGHPQSYWEVKDQPYDGNVFVIPDQKRQLPAEIVSRLNNLLKRYQSGIKEQQEFSPHEKKLAIQLKSKNWENTFFEQKTK